MAEVLLAVGTQKGLFLGRSHDRRHWVLDGPHFTMNSVYSVALDTRTPRPRVLVGADSTHWGPSVWWSDDLGGSWQEPTRPAVRFPEGTGASLERVWQLRPAGDEAPGVVFAGTEPAALFRSEDGGETFSLVEPLWQHPQRAQWGAGFGGQGLHTVLTDPRDRDRVTVAVSTGGVYRTADGAGRHRTPVSGRSSCRRGRSSPSSGSACTRSRRMRRTRTGCICRTTAVSTAATTRGRAGGRSTRGFLPTSGSPWRPIRTGAAPPMSSR